MIVKVLESYQENFQREEEEIRVLVVFNILDDIHNNDAQGIQNQRHTYASQENHLTPEHVHVITKALIRERVWPSSRVALTRFSTFNARC